MNVGFKCCWRRQATPVITVPQVIYLLHPSLGTSIACSIAFPDCCSDTLSTYSSMCVSTNMPTELSHPPASLLHSYPATTVILQEGQPDRPSISSHSLGQQWDLEPNLIC